MFAFGSMHRAFSLRVTPVAVIVTVVVIGFLSLVRATSSGISSSSTVAVITVSAVSITLSCRVLGISIIFLNTHIISYPF